MQNYSVWGVIFMILIFANSVQLQCTCIQNKNFVNCRKIRLNEMHTGNGKDRVGTISIGDEKVLPEKAISFTNVLHAKLLCEIEELTTNSFINQDRLNNLDLSGNFLSTIPNDFFVAIPVLKNLNLSHNTLENPTLDTFYALNNLKDLDISYNDISSLELGVLDEMKKLQKLYLNNNKISIIPLGFFDNSHNLLVLDLSYNHLHELVLGLFDESQKLTDVHLAGNYFSGEVPLGTFDSFKNVLRLDLKDCQIEKLPLGIFDEATKLIELDLSMNKIRSLPLGIFDRASNLKAIDLHKSGLSEVADHQFDKNKHLERIDLSSNRLQTLPGQLFRLNENFKYLNLSKNLISDLPVEIFQRTALKEIDMSYNKFTTIKPDLLNMETLEKVHAQNNFINYLDELTFATSNYTLKYLDIRNNRLVFIGEYFFDWITSLERMEIFGNPWDCDCLNDLLDLLAKRSIEYSSKDYLEGKLPVCISMQLDSNKCDINRINHTLIEYYELYSKQPNV